MYASLVKPFLDRAFALIGLVLLLPILLAVAIWIWLDSGRPFFYKGVRVGQQGKQFYIYKFRTMYCNSEKKGRDTTANNDPRITRAGKILRKYKLDELPQLINVLIGNMSFVGPRPELKYYTDRYTQAQKAILNVKPGITDYSSIYFNDLSMVVGDSNADDNFEEKVLPLKNQLRLKYVDDLSLKADFKILFSTIKVILKKRG